MIQLKACPRCGGDIKHSGDIYGNYAECLQCGFMKDIVKQMPIRFRDSLFARREPKAI